MLFTFDLNVIMSHILVTLICIGYMPSSALMFSNNRRSVFDVEDQNLPDVTPKARLS